jgi:PhnB protein
MTEATDLGRLMKGVIPYLTIAGADDAIAFYQRAFGAIQHGETARGQAGRVLNAGLEINGGMIMIADHVPDMDEGTAKAGQGIMMQIVTHEGQAFWDRAIGAGCVVIAPFELQFWGDTWGRFNDPFGIGWAVNQPSAENLAIANAMSKGDAA